MKGRLDRVSYTRLHVRTRVLDMLRCFLSSRRFLFFVSIFRRRGLLHFSRFRTIRRSVFFGAFSLRMLFIRVLQFSFIFVYSALTLVSSAELFFAYFADANGCLAALGAHFRPFLNVFGGIEWPLWRPRSPGLLGVNQRLSFKADSLFGESWCASSRTLIRRL